MLLVCPACETAFRVGDDALGAGREVRCSRCQTTWFATPPATGTALVPAEPAMRLDLLPAADEETPAPLAEDVVVWEPLPSAPATESPPASAAIADALEAAEPPRPAASAWSKLKWRGGEPRPAPGRMFVAVTLALAGIVVAALVAPATMVRALPDLAGLYAKAGVQVNLRGLELRDVRTTRELHDGIALLVTEGRVVNVSGRELEVPPIRLAALSPNGQELYAWTAAPSRPIVADGDSVTFKSRLASPPAEARRVDVRFVTRADLAWAYR
jgi:predicted Zn finger-like uncharacterized protein